MQQDTIEIIRDEGNGVVDGQQIHEWQRETMFVSTYGFCVYCDDPIEQPIQSDRTETERYRCLNCGRAWIDAGESFTKRGAKVSSHLTLDDLSTGDRLRDTRNDRAGRLVRGADTDMGGSEMCKIEYEDMTRWIPSDVLSSELNERYIRAGSQR